MKKCGKIRIFFVFVGSYPIFVAGKLFLIVMDNGSLNLVGFGDCGVVADDRESLELQNIIQPKTVTYLKFRFSRIQQRILVHVVEELSVYMTNNIEKINPRELITVPLFCSHYGRYKHDSRGLFEEVSKLKRETDAITFTWTFEPQKFPDLYKWMLLHPVCFDGSGHHVLPKGLYTFEKKSSLFTDIQRCYEDPGKLLIGINPSMLPFLLYFGRGNGGTMFDKDVALALSSVYSHRLYLVLCDLITFCPSKVFSLDEFRELLGYSEKYLPRDIKNHILVPFQKELVELNSELLFDFEFKYDLNYGFARSTHGAPAANCVVLTVRKREFIDWNELSRKQLLVMLQQVSDKEKNYLCPSLAEQIVKNGLAGKLKSKFSYYDKKVSERKMSAVEYKNTMLKIVRELTGVDLRSEYHIKNSVKLQNRTKRTRKVEFTGTLFSSVAD